MFFRACVLVFLLFLSQIGWAQPEGLIVVPHKDGLAIVHKVWEGETIFSVAALYHAPPAQVADVNGLSFRDQDIEHKSELLVPVGVYNQLTNPPADPAQTRPLYYQVRPEDDLYRVSWRSNISAQKLTNWNKLSGTRPSVGSYMLVGWVNYDTAHIAPAAKREKIAGEIAVVPLDTVKNQAPVNSLEELYLKQIQDGGNIITEKGTAVFFHMPGKSSSEFYVFHNGAPKGTVIKVVNPGSGKAVFVKVLGPIPQTKQYHNAIIGIPDRAKSSLGVRENKMWAELSYTGY